MPMMQEDYIMRQIQQFTNSLVQILFRKKNEDYDEALALIQQTGQLVLGLDLKAIHTISYEALQEAFRVKDVHDAEHVSVVAELLQHQGDCFAHGSFPEAAPHSYTLALDLYLDLYTSDRGTQLPNLAPRIDVLLDALDPLTLDAATQAMLFRFYNKAGRFADAEDVLFHLADTHPTPALYAEGVAFFERLLRTSYRHLHAGNLPYNEVKEGLAAFQQKALER